MNQPSPRFSIYTNSELWQSKPMKDRRSFSIDPEVGKLADKMNVEFGYNNFSKLIEDLIRSAAEATEIVLLPGKHGKPSRRVFVVPRPDTKR